MNSEMALLKNIIKGLFEIDIDRSIRKREFVDCRLIYSKILRDRGHTSVSIGKSICKDHSTILHYISKAEDLISRDEVLGEKYIICKNTFYQLAPFKSSETSKKFVLLVSDNERLIEEKNKINNELKKYDRIKAIINIIDQRTPKGMEKVIEDRINKMFNGYNIKELTYYERLKEVGER